MVSLHDFFDGPYCRRLCNIQEFTMGNHNVPVLFGDFVTQWRYVRDAALVLCMMADTIEDGMQRTLMRSGRQMKGELSC
jgi:hypothetical protein